MRDKKGRLGFALCALAVSGLMAAPVTAHADDPGKGGKGKKPDMPIVIGTPTIVHDPPKKGK